MQLKKHSWFLDYYCMYDHRSYPQTVCQLAWRIIRQTLFYITVILGLFGPLICYFMHGTFLPPKNGIDGLMAQILIFIYVITYAILFIFSLAAVIMGIIMGIVFLIEKVNSIERVDSVVSPVVDFSKGVIARIKDKTCMMITYKS